MLAKILNTPVQVVYRPGAGAQIGLTELVRSKPDGYTIGYGNLPVIPVIYLDPTRKAVFARKDFQPIATHFTTAGVISVLAASPYKTLKDLLDAARAEPGKIKMGTTGLMGVTHLAGLLLEKTAGVKFAYVHFNGDAPAATALLGGHVDATPHTVTGIYPHIKSGAIRPLTVMDTEESPFLPGVKTTQSQGYNVQMVATMGIHAPAGTPPEVVTILAEAIKKAHSDEQHKKEMAELAFTLRYLGPEQLAAFWSQMEAQVKPLLDEIRTQQ
jgi:tripartite-type tricarboxylate transporter receptor subunit TctC